MPESSVDTLTRLANSLAKFTESMSVDYSTLYSLSPQDLGIGDSPGFWPNGLTSAGLMWLDRRKRGDYIPAFLSGQQLAIYRRRIRALVVNNEIALNAVNLHTVYAVGKGFSYECTPRGEQFDPGVIRDTQAVVDAFGEHNELPLREAEILTRMLIDGECFKRLFPTDCGIMNLRYIEPEHVFSPTGDEGNSSFGVESNPGDVESVRGYWINEHLNGKPEYTSCDSVVHFKFPETPATSKRGLSAFYPVEGPLRAAEDLLYSTVAMAKARAKIAWVRKLQDMTADVANALVAAQATFTGTDPVSGEAINQEQYRPGTILTTNADIQFPNANIAASDHVAVMQMVLRIIAARFSMPEYMLTADASNGNYSSTLVAESPFVKSMERLQEYIARLLGGNRYPGSRQSMMWRQICYAIKIGVLPPEAFRMVALQVQGPSLTVRDVAKEAQVDKIYAEMKVKSRKTIQIQQGLDPDEENRNLAAENPPPPPMVLPGQALMPGQAPPSPPPTPAVTSPATGGLPRV